MHAVTRVALDVEFVERAAFQTSGPEGNSMNRPNAAALAVSSLAAGFSDRLRCASGGLRRRYWRRPPTASRSVSLPPANNPQIDLLFRLGAFCGREPIPGAFTHSPDKRGCEMARSGVWILLVFLGAPTAAQDAAEAQESRVEVVGSAGAFVTEKTARPWAEVFVGGGIVFQDAEVPVGHLGGGIWMTRNLRVGGRLDLSGVIGLLSVHYRLRMADDWELLVGTSPVWYQPGWGGGVAPIVEALVSRRISPRFRVRCGTSAFLGDGGHIHLLGRVVYSFD